ncbi:MAG: HIT family protein [Bacteroidota bacterium]
MACIFCDIISGKTSAEIIYQDELVICFMDIYPINHGHILLVPKTHYPDLFDLPDNIASHIINVSKKLSRNLKEVYSPDGITIFQSNGYFNEIGHYHMHLFPRYKNDGFRFSYPEIERKKENLKSEAKRIKVI